MSRRPIALIASVAVLVAGPLLPGLPATAAVTPCSRGSVALTFDDGPRPVTTAATLDILAGRGVRATFFVVGAQVDRHPGSARRSVREGHRVENHSYGHEQLPALSSAGVRHTLRRANSAVRAAGLQAPQLYRPPYGATNDRVRAVAAAVGLREVLWTVDPQDWRTGRSAKTITDRVLGGLSPGAIVLLHDGTANAPATVAALPAIIDGARRRGYCFGTLTAAGKVLPPVPRVSIGNATVVEGREGTSTMAALSVTLSEPTSRAIYVRAVSRAGSATAGHDFSPVRATVRFAAGSRRATVKVPVPGDDADEATERFRVELRSPRGATLGRKAGAVTITDDDASGGP